MANTGMALDDEAKKLQLTRASASPEAWRSRAASAGGFLSAAAVVSLWGLAQQASRLTGSTKVAAVSATVLYALSVVAFLIAVVFPSPKAPDETDDFTEEFLEYAKKESKRIRVSVWIGAGLAALGVICTAACAVLLFVTPLERHAWVSIRADSTKASFAHLCPGLGDPFEADITDQGTDYLKIRVPAASCSGKGTTLTVLRADLVIVEGRGSS